MSVARLSSCSIDLFNPWLFLFKFGDSCFAILLLMADIRESPAAGAVLVVVALRECFAVTYDGSGPVAVLNYAPLLYHNAREDRAIESGGVIDAVDGLDRVTVQRLGSDVDASQLSTHFVHFGCQGDHLRLLGINLPVLSVWG